MVTKYLFADESGNFDFSRKNGATRYFAVGTFLVEGEPMRLRLERELSQTRYALIEKGFALEGAFHATTDKQAVRDDVFEAVNRTTFRADVTMLEKSKAQPQLTASDERFYQYAWYYHFKPLIWRHVVERGDRLIVVAASLGTKKKRQLFRDAVNDVIAQCCPYGISRQVVALSDESDYGLQAADYVLWAVMRKYEGGDSRSYDLVSSSVASEYDLFQGGTKHYY